MTDFQFNENGNMPLERKAFRRYGIDTEPKGMVGWLIQKGIVRDENIGQIILIGVAIFFFTMSALVFFII